MEYVVFYMSSSALQNIRPVTSRLKQGELVESLTKLARELGPGARLPRVKQLAKALGVSLVTLDAGLRQLEQRDLIERHAGSGIYVTHCILQKTVGLVLGWDIFSTSAAAAYSILLDQCFKRAAAHRLRFSFFLDLPDLNRVSFNSLVHQDLVAALADGKLDGLLIASAQGPEQEFWLRQQGVPAVSLNIGGIPNSVVVDRAKIIATAARELVKAGCKEIGLIASIEVDLDLFARHATEMGFHYEESWIKPAAELPPPQKVDPRTRGITAAKEIMDAASTGLTPRMPDGLIITDDVIASGVCSYLSKHYVIGRDIKIACHANKGSPVLDPWQDVLIRCEIDPAEIAEVMFSMLETLMDGKPLASDIATIPPHLKLPGAE